MLHQLKIHSALELLRMALLGCRLAHEATHWQFKVYVVVNFLSQVIFVFLLFLGMVMYANEIETKEK